LSQLKRDISIYSNERRTNIAKILGALCFVLLFGTIGFQLLEGWSLIDSVYMAVITLSTVGFLEPQPLSVAGRVFTIIYIITGVGLVTYSVGMITRMIIEGEVQQILGRRRTMTKINRLKDHYIICGFGRIGQMVAAEFERRPMPFVVIENDDVQARKLPADYPLVVGDATEEEVLLSAGIERAKGLVTVLHSDAENLFVTLSARELNPKLFIISRYEEERTKSKLLRAGADSVVSPYIIGGTRMAMAVLRPAVIDFIELATESESLGLQMEEVLVPADSPLKDVCLAESNIRAELNIIVVAVKKRSGHMEFNPAADSLLEEGDKMIAIGEVEQLQKLEKMVNPNNVT
jgi:voltage-gated potassium channel